MIIGKSAVSRFIVSSLFFCTTISAVSAQNTVWLSPNTYGNDHHQAWFYRAPVWNTNMAGSLHEDALGWSTTYIFSEEQHTAQGQAYWEILYHGSINCPAKTLRISGNLNYADKNGQLLFNAGDAAFSDPVPVTPGTLGGDLYNFMCGG